LFEERSIRPEFTPGETGCTPLASRSAGGEAYCRREESVGQAWALLCVLRPRSGLWSAANFQCGTATDASTEASDCLASRHLGNGACGDVLIAEASNLRG